MRMIPADDYASFSLTKANKQLVTESLVLICSSDGCLCPADVKINMNKNSGTQTRDGERPMKAHHCVCLFFR